MLFLNHYCKKSGVQWYSKPYNFAPGSYQSRSSRSSYIYVYSKKKIEEIGYRMGVYVRYVLLYYVYIFIIRLNMQYGPFSVRMNTNKNFTPLESPCKTSHSQDILYLHVKDTKLKEDIKFNTPF